MEILVLGGNMKKYLILCFIFISNLAFGANYEYTVLNSSHYNLVYSGFFNPSHSVDVTGFDVQTPGSAKLTLDIKPKPLESGKDYIVISYLVERSKHNFPLLISLLFYYDIKTGKITNLPDFDNYGIKVVMIGSTILITSSSIN
jgi:hypothetical protein